MLLKKPFLPLALYDRKKAMGTPKPDSSAALIHQIAQGNRDSFGEFYDRFAPFVYSFALRLLRQRNDAEDLLQEVFLQVWRQAGTYRRERGSPEAWLSTITRTRAIDKLRSQRRRNRNIDSLEKNIKQEEKGKVESGAEESHARLTVNSALAQLPEAQRNMLTLAYFDGLTQTEIAERLSVPLGTVKTRIRTGLKHLQEQLAVKKEAGSYDQR